MVDRTKPNAMPYRQGVTSYVQDMICNKRTLHIDIWLYQMPDDVLYFHAVTSAGGIVLIAAMTWRVDPTGLYPVENIQNIASVGLGRYIGSPWARKNIPWIDAIYARDVLPYVRGELPAGYKRRSVCMWCIWSNPTLNDPFDGIENMYDATARAARDTARTMPGVRVIQKRRLPEWTARERSMLRTLQKLLD